MILSPTHIGGVWTIENFAFEDSRGRFARVFCAKELSRVIGSRAILQVNHSLSSKVGSVRGFHFQHPPHAEMKIIRCLKGRIFDVAVDLRRGSPTLLHWTAVELSADHGNAIVIPEGCAHGFQVLEPDSELLYIHTASYSPQNEGAILFDEPKVGVKWPLEPTDLSQRDLSHPLLADQFEGFDL